MTFLVYPLPNDTMWRPSNEQKAERPRICTNPRLARVACSLVGLPGTQICPIDCAPEAPNARSGVACFQIGFFFFLTTTGKQLIVVAVGTENLALGSKHPRK